MGGGDSEAQPAKRDRWPDGAATKDGFVLEQPNIQVFERKVREGEPAKQVEAEAALASSSQQPSTTNEAGTQAEVKNSPGRNQAVRET